MCDVSIGRLIKVVSRMPCLWDVTHALYKDQEAKKFAWNQACSELLPEYYYMSLREQEEYSE